MGGEVFGEEASEAAAECWEVHSVGDVVVQQHLG